MSIGSIQSNPWANPWSVASQSGTNASWNAAPASDGPAASGTQVTPANPFQQLASNIEAMLIQARSTVPNTQTASTNPTDPVSQTGHHHHHHEAGGDASGATAVAGGDQAVSRVFAAYDGASASSM